jgi:hypothetical protein
MGTTSPTGDFCFSIAAGGCCVAAPALQIIAGPVGAGVLLASYPDIGTTDNDGDGITGIGDFVRFAACFAGAPPPPGGFCFDYANCDVLCNLGDFVVFEGAFVVPCMVGPC